MTKPHHHRATPIRGVNSGRLVVGSICTGVGGIEYALTLTGASMRLAWMAEPNRHAAHVLSTLHPGVPNVGDITTINPADLAPVNIICAGFPCQDLSNAGNRQGINGPKSGLWWTIADTISVVRPRWVLLENVAAITARGGTQVNWIAYPTRVRHGMDDSTSIGHRSTPSP